MRLNDDEASGGEGLQQRKEKMCQTAGGESGLSSGSFPFIETLDPTERGGSHHLLHPLAVTVTATVQPEKKNL